MSVFSILNIPPKLKKDEVFKNLELINLQYNRLYKQGFYWILSTTDKETLICVQNSLRTLTFDDMKPKYSLKNQNQIWDLIKEQVDKILYQKDSKNLGISKNNNNNRKNSKGDQDAFSWRKGSTEVTNNNDFSEKRYKKGYYNNNNNYKKRKRFNSDNAISNNNNYNYNNNYEEYKPYNNSNTSNINKNIEIDISALKYQKIIKNKYTFKDFQKFYEKMKNAEKNPFLEQKNKEIFGELISDKPKIINALEDLVKLDNKEKKEDVKEKEINTNIKIPKMNPLSNMTKGNFNDKKNV